MQRQLGKGEWKEKIKVEKKENNYVMGTNPFDAEEMLLRQERIFIEQQDETR